MENEVLRDKALVRTHLRQMRAAVPDSERAAAGEAAARLGAVVGMALARPAALPESEIPSAFIYESAGSEVPTERLIRVFLSMGWDVLLPNSQGRDAVTDEFRLRTGTESVRVVKAGDELDAVRWRTRAIFLPGLGWDAWGTRLGQGGGYYDRVLGLFPPEAPRIGLAYDIQQFADGVRLPSDSHDVPFTHLITPRGMWLPSPDTGCWRR